MKSAAPIAAKLLDRMAPLLPTVQQTLFLRACLHEGQPAHKAWDQWNTEATRDGTTLRHTLALVNPFLLLLHWNLKRNGINLDAGLETHFRAAHLTEELRWRQYHRICGSAFRALGDANVPFVVVKGAALSELIYPVPLMRHADDIDVLLHADDLQRAAAALVQLGWGREKLRTLSSPLHLSPIVHPSGVSIELHRRLLMPYYALPYSRLWERSQAASLAGVDVRILSAGDNLLHVCAHAMSGQQTLRWVPDAWFILQRFPELDWLAFVSTAVPARLGLPVYVALRYLIDQIGVGIPASMLEELQVAAARTGFRGRAAARPWPGGSDWDASTRTRSWWHRLAVAWQRGFPPPVQFALYYDIRLWELPFYYFYRMARFARGYFLDRTVRPVRSNTAPGKRS